MAQSFKKCSLHYHMTSISVKSISKKKNKNVEMAEIIANMCSSNSKTETFLLELHTHTPTSMNTVF